jgi:hypothetical protein
MGAVSSLSRESTTLLLDIAQIGVFVFGFFFLGGWIAEETTKEHRWNRYHTLFVVMAISGVAGEWLADIAVFALSEHLQTISDKEVAKLKLDTQHLATEEAAARRAIAEANEHIADARRDASNANALAKEAEAHLAEANARASEANAKAEQFRLAIAQAQSEVAEARRETARLQAQIQPRDLNPEQQAELAKAVQPFAGHAVRFDWYVLDVEGLRLAVEIQAALTVAHIKLIPGNAMLPGGSIAMGVKISAPETERVFALKIFDALNNAKLMLRNSEISAIGTPVIIEIGVKPVPAFLTIREQPKR